MTGMEEARWRQRFRNYARALQALQRGAVTLQGDPNNELMQAGIIQTYECAFELAWKTLKDFLDSEGYDTPSPKAAIRQAFQSGYINDGEMWMEALGCRNLTVHTYDEDFAASAVRDIITRYLPMLQKLHDDLGKEL